MGAAGRVGLDSSLLGLKDADLSLLVSALGYGHIIAIQLRTVKACPCAWRRRYASQGLVTISGFLLHQIDQTFSAGDVQTLPFYVIKQIIGIAANANVRHGFAVRNIEHHQAGRLPTAYE